MDIYTLREQCIFCNSNIDKTYFEEDKYLYISSNICNDITNTKIKIPYNILLCMSCGCYQNKYLGNLDMVYNDNHNNVVISDIWIKHYDEFYNFIMNNNIIHETNSILEIGAGNNYIVNSFLNNNYKNYTILEPVITNKLDNVKYVSGWLENNDIVNEKYELTILSHVFEHLYRPNELFKVNTKYIAISIPNIPKYIEQFILNFLNIEHTFHFEENHITTFFNNHKYQLVDKNYYSDHSIFMLFEMDELLLPISYNDKIIPSIHSKFDTYFNKIYTLIHNINNYVNSTKKKFAIFPANMYIQYLISMGLDVKNISYFYDNNKNKLDKYLYGTDILCKNLDYFVSKNEYEIILLGFLYNDEIKTILEKNGIRYHLPY